MSSLAKKITGMGIMTVAVGVSLSACADNESSLFIRQVLVPSSDCTVTADPGSLSYSKGVLDLALSLEFSAALLVGNQLVERGNGDQLRSETSRVRIEGAEVRVETTGGAELSAYTVAVNGFADPATGTTPGWGFANVVLLNEAAGQTVISLAGFGPGRSTAVERVISVVKVFGTTLGGQEVESAEFRFPNRALLRLPGLVSAWHR